MIKNIFIINMRNHSEKRFNYNTSISIKTPEIKNGLKMRSGREIVLVCGNKLP